jgi:hypothetical protein
MSLRLRAENITEAIFPTSIDQEVPAINLEDSKHSKKLPAIQTVAVYRIRSGAGWARRPTPTEAHRAHWITSF